MSHSGVYTVAVERGEATEDVSKVGVEVVVMLGRSLMTERGKQKEVKKVEKIGGMR